MTSHIEERISRPWGTITILVDTPKDANDATVTQIRDTIKFHAGRTGVKDKDILRGQIALSRHPGLNVLVVDFQPYSPRRISCFRDGNGNALFLMGRLQDGAKLTEEEREAFYSRARSFTPSGDPTTDRAAIDMIQKEVSTLLPVDVVTGIEVVPVAAKSAIPAAP